MMKLTKDEMESLTTDELLDYLTSQVEYARRKLAQVEGTLLIKRALAAKTCPSPNIERMLAFTRNALVKIQNVESVIREMTGE